MPGTSVPSVLPATPPRTPGQTESRTVKPKTDFVLVDALGRVREFPSGRADELILLDFMTTTCLPCKKAIPTLKGLQSRYGARGLEVIGVVCDETDTPQRRAFAARYADQQQLNYLLYVEPGQRPGQVMERFGVEFFPTLVLVDGTGAVRWKGDSRDLGKLDAIIAQNLRR
jgi:thiol-disulfide isomerase/thioredoxin